MSQQQIVCKRRTARQQQDEEEWDALSTLAALDAIENEYHEKRVDYSKKKGSLVVIGSGIKCVGQFSLEAIGHLKHADKVLYCVADPATEQFIRELCPDALDMYVLYANGKNRYDTYVQMAESTLYYARQGLHTVMVFYGHPGIFVMPSHRAIKIAQQQGIKTLMLPAISALDCLTADLGIDPSYPGMMTVEATDLVLRDRTLLTDMHVIIWQVGCVGDLGFVRTGYMNQHLPVLIKQLQGTYGEDYVITHYMGAQYPTCSPTIVKLPLSKILEPDVTKTITGISTFYIPPKVAKEVIPENAQQMKLIPKQGGKALLKRPYTKCGLQEKKAIHNLLNWKVPPDYAHYTPNKLGQYVGNLAQDVFLLKAHKKAPVKTMRAAGLATKDISTMLKSSPNYIRMSMKAGADSIATKVAIRLMTDPKFASEFFGTLKKYQSDHEGEKKVHDWLTSQGYDTTLDDVQAAFKKLQQTSLLPWTATYTTNLESITITIGGKVIPSLSQLWVNNTPITKFTFTNQILSWSSKDGNTSSASLTFVDGGSGKLSFSGKYYKSGDKEPSSNNISGHNTGTKASLSNWVGSYTTKLNEQSGPAVVISAVQSGTYSITVEGVAISHYTFAGANVLSWSEKDNSTNGELTFIVENAGKPTVRRRFSGWYWKKGTSKPQANFGGDIEVANFKPYLGMYKSFVKDSKGSIQYGPECFLTQASGGAASFKIGSTVIKSPVYTNSTITWTKKDGNTDNGTIIFFIDPKKHTPGFNGKTWTGSTAPTTANFFGSFDASYLQEWAGIYTINLQEGSSWSPSAQMTVSAAKTPSEVQVSYGTTPIKSPVFNNPVMTWSQSAGNATNAEITFYYDDKRGPGPLFYGKQWKDKKPDSPNIQGAIDSWSLMSWTGDYSSYLKDTNGKYTVDGPKVAIAGAMNEADTTVSVNGKKIHKYTFNSADHKIQWSDTDNDTNGDLKLSSKDTKSGRTFSGNYWQKGGKVPPEVNIAGKTGQPPSYPQGDASEAGGFWTFKNFANMIELAVIVIGAVQGIRVLWRAYQTGDLNQIKSALENLRDVFNRGSQQLAENEAANPEQAQLEVEPSPEQIEPQNNVDIDITEIYSDAIDNVVMDNSVENTVEVGVENNVENVVEIGVENAVDLTMENAEVVVDPVQYIDTTVEGIDVTVGIDITNPAVDVVCSIM